jgi:hypothetical protein
MIKNEKYWINYEHGAHRAEVHQKELSPEKLEDQLQKVIKLQNGIEQFEDEYPDLIPWNRGYLSRFD